MKNKRSGFTIVELLIVIVIIAILAAITVVAFNGTQQRARDSSRKSDIAYITKGLVAYKVDNGTLMTTNSGCGYAGNGGGWFAVDWDGTGPLKSDSQCLVDAKLASREIIDPSGQRSCGGSAATCYAYIKADCGDITYLMAHLESQPLSSTATDQTCATDYDSAYGVNYVVKVS